MRNNERICRALLSLLCCLALVVGLGGGAGAEAAAGPEAIHLPVVEADDLELRVVRPLSLRRGGG